MIALNPGRLSVVLLVAVLLAGAGTGQASTGLAFLKRGVDARSMILGEAVTSHVGDASSCYWNPAGLSRMESPQLMITHVESFADLRHEYAAAVQPIGKLAAGLFFNGLWTEDMDGYDSAGNPTGRIGYSSYAAGVALGARAIWGFSVGATCKYLHEFIGDYTTSGWAVDLGTQWTISEEFPLQFGLAVQNLGSSMSYIEESFDLPLTVQGGVSWDLPLQSLSGRLLMAADIRHLRDEGTVLLFGVEYSYAEFLRFGLGYQEGRDVQDVGVGIGIHQGWFGLDWAYIPISEDLGDENRFTIGITL